MRTRWSPDLEQVRVSQLTGEVSHAERDRAAARVAESEPVQRRLDTKTKAWGCRRSRW